LLPLLLLPREWGEQRGDLGGQFCRCADRPGQFAGLRRGRQHRRRWVGSADLAERLGGLCPEIGGQATRGLCQFGSGLSGRPADMLDGQGKRTLLNVGGVVREDGRGPARTNRMACGGCCAARTGMSRGSVTMSVTM
jgi:hypothetical protein